MYKRQDLYMAIGYAECSANELMNLPNGSYQEIFHRVSEKLSYAKSHRYTAQEIAVLNAQTQEEHERECIVCGRSDRLVSENTVSYTHLHRRDDGASLFQDSGIRR